VVGCFRADGLRVNVVSVGRVNAHVGGALAWKSKS
jgi:hypothetical protein